MPEDAFGADVGLLGALTIGVGTMIGAGIFVLPSVAAEAAGGQLVLVFALGGAIALLNALVVSELGSGVPASGGAYYWIDRTLGPLAGTVAGISDWIGLVAASAFYVLGFGTYFGYLVALPEVGLLVVTLSPEQFGAMLAAGVVVLLHYLGARELGGVQTAVVGGLVGVLTLFVLVGLFSSGAQPPGETPTTPGQGGELFGATALIFVSYLGYAKVATVGAELRSPERTLPRAVIGSVVFVTALYVGIASVVSGVLPVEPATADPAMITAADGLLGTTGVLVVAVTGLVATATSANLSILSTVRISFTMGRDRLVVDWLNNLHRRFATPYRSLQVTGLLVIVAVLVGDLVTLALIAVGLHLVVYGLTTVSLFVLRLTDPDEYEPPFTVPLYPLVPAAALALTGALFLALPGMVQLFAGLVVFGAGLWYALYGRRHVDREGILSEYLLGRAAELPDPAVAAARAARPEQAEYRVMVPLSNPNTAEQLTTVAAGIAAERNGTVVATHVIEVPDQLPLDRAPEYLRMADPEPITDELVETARETAAEFDVEVESRVVYSHQALEEVFDAARRWNVDAVVMGWWGREPAVGGRTESSLDELAHNLPCDVFVLRDRDFDPARIVIPTAGTPNDDLCATVATRFAETFDSEITLLHVVGGESARGGGERFLEDWAERMDLDDAKLEVAVSSDLEAAIGAAADEHTLLLIGASERGLLSRLVRRSLIYDVVERVDSSVLLAETKQDRSLLDRLIGR